MNIDGYGPLKAPVKGGGNVHFMDRADARKVYDNTIDKIPERIEALRHLCEQNGYSNDPAGWTALVADNVEVERDDDGIAELTPVWKNVMLDIGLAISQLLIDRSGGQLRWKFYTGSKNSLDYQRPVLVGFGNVASKTYHLNLYLPMTNFALTAATDEPMRDLDEYLDYIATQI